MVRPKGCETCSRCSKRGEVSIFRNGAVWAVLGTMSYRKRAGECQGGWASAI
jgi:hypothetical protein